MKRIYFMAIICASLMGCDDDNDGGGKGKNTDDNTPAAEDASCKPDSFESVCKEIEGNPGYQVCQLNNKGLYKAVDVVCKSDETCHIYEGKPAWK